MRDGVAILARAIPQDCGTHQDLELLAAATAASTTEAYPRARTASIPSARVMTFTSPSVPPILQNTMNDATSLDHFVQAQAPVYEQVLRELAGGRKQTHWMWFIFPQLRGLGHSAISERFALDSIDHAERYLDHKLLGPRLLECTRLVLAIPNPDPKAIFGDPDWMKFRSSMTLFSRCPNGPSAFPEAIGRCFSGVPDETTLRLLERRS